MTMRGAHYTCPNDTVMTNKWHSATAVTNLCPTITYLAPAAITNYISQTRRPGVRKPGSLSPKKGCFLFHNSDFCSRKLTLTDFSRLFSALVRRRHGRMPTFFHLWPYFHLSQFFPSQFGWKEKLIFLTYSEPCTPGTSIFSCDFQKGRRNRSFWHIPWCTPRDIALSAIVNVHFNFGSVDIQSFCLGDSAQIPASLILLFAYSNVTFLSVIQISSLLFPNISLIKSDYWGFLGGADIKFSRLHSNKYFGRKHFELIH